MGHLRQRAASLIAACSLRVVCFASVKSFSMGGLKVCNRFQCFLEALLLVVGTTFTVFIFLTVGFNANHSLMTSGSNEVPCFAWWACTARVALKSKRFCWYLP